MQGTTTRQTGMRCEHDIIYVIDPDEAVHDALTTLLGANGIQVVCHPNAEAFFDSGIARSLKRGCLLVEANLPGMGSLALLRRLRAQGVDLPVLVLTSTSNREIANQALKAGAVEVIEKPLVGGRLLNRLRHLDHHNDGARAEPKG
jgi:FixJ family two-component response regulator